MPILVGIVSERLEHATCDTRVVDRSVEPPEPFDRFGDHCLDIGADSNVGADEQTFTASRLHLVALRDVGGEEFGKLFVRGMEANATREEFAKSISSVVRMGQIFSDAKLFKQGDVILMDYVPGTGTVISHKGKPLGDAFKEADFHSLLMKIWFGPKPADEALRGALLGQKTSANSNVN